jgi:hypothetical protein
MNDMSFMTQRLRDFVYFPHTDWREFFRPTFYFGCNVNDAATEREVLDDVGSYGKQINRILDGLDVLIRLDEPALANLNEADREAIVLLKKLHRDAAAASARAEERSSPCC